MNLEDHNYFRFIKAVLGEGIPVQWDENEATITLGTRGTKMKARFSYNEPKIYFTITDQKSFRVLDNGAHAAEVVGRINAIYRALDASLDVVIGDVDE